MSTTVYGIFVNNNLRRDLGLYYLYDDAFKVAYNLSQDVNKGDRVEVNRPDGRIDIYGEHIFHTVVTVEAMIIYDRPHAA